MELIKATSGDFERLARFYRGAILNTNDMQLYAKWIYGKHPTDEMIMNYIAEGSMFFCEKDGGIVSAAGVTPYQGEDYSAVFDSLADNEAAVVHILCVDPTQQRQGNARETMRLIIEHSRKLGKKAVRLDALACNTPAQRLYESLGFRKAGVQRWDTKNAGAADFFLYELIL
ncbi:MAG: GNAT family N-acetyltransferase [Oscillospiraceae bacterium]